MKSAKVVIATLIAVALMVTPIALFAMEDNQSEAATDFTELSQMLDEIDTGKLIALMMTEYKTAEPASGDQTISGTVTVDPGDFLYMDKNFKFDANAKLSVSSGASLTIKPTQSFSISTNSGYGCIELKKDSSIVFTNDNQAPTDDTPLSTGNIIAEIPVEQDTVLYFTGKATYTHDALEFILTVDAGTVIADSATAAEREMEINFPTENKIDFKIDSAGTDANKAVMEFKLTAAIDMKMPVPVSDTESKDVILKGNANYTIKTESPVSQASTLKDSTLTVKGNGEFTAGFDNYNGTVKNSADITVKTTNVNTKDAKTTLRGSVSLEVSTSNMDNYKPDKDSDVAITVRDANAKYKLNLDNDKVSGEIDMNLGKYALTMFDDTGDQTMTFEGLKVYGKYEGKYSPAAQVANLSGLSALSSSSQPDPSKWVKEYMDGIKPTMTESEVKEYAAGFFLGKIDSTAGLDNAGITGTYLKAEFNIGNMDYQGTTLSGLRSNVEISDSVGLKASVSLDKLVMMSNKQTSSFVGNNSKIIVGSSNVSLVTSADGKSMFNCEFSASAEVREYSTSGALVANPYIKDFKGKVLISTNSTVESLTIGELAFNSYGVYTKATNLSLDTKKNTFTADEVRVSGNYYGEAPIRSVDGTYKNFTMTATGGLSLFSTSVESVSLRIDALNGDHMDFSRSYDATNKTIVNTYNVDGQMSLFDILNDGALTEIMYPTLTDAAQATPETNVFKGGVLVPGGSVITNEPPADPTYDPALTVAGKSISVKFNRYYPLTSMTLEGKAPAQVYVDKPAGTGVMKINDQNITLSLSGVTVGVALDDAGAVSYSLMALPGFTLSKDMTYNGFTLGDCNEKTATITDVGSSISCTANPIKYKINLDGKTVKDDAVYGKSVTGVTVENDVLMVVDPNGAVVGQVSGTTWFPGVYYYTKDLDAKTVTGKTLTTVEKSKINKITDASSVRFTVPAGGSSLQFALSSKVRFDLSGLSADDDIELVAQTTNYNGHDAFIIKASNGSSAQTATLYIPVSNTNSKLMHVDEYGRASERQADVVTIDGENYLKTTTSDYSIFYAETDSSPVLDNGGNGPNFLLIAIGVVVAVALIAGAVVFIKKH